jgi:hypothetical protein
MYLQVSKIRVFIFSIHFACYFFFLQKTDAPLQQVEHCIESVCKEEEVFTFLKADDNGHGSGYVSWDRGPRFRNQFIGFVFTNFYFTCYL